MRGATFNEAQLEGAILVGVLAENASFQGANLVGARLSAAQLTGANFDFASMEASYFEKSILIGASFYLTQLQGARIAYSDLLGANLHIAQLQGATLYASDLQAANLSGAYMQLAHFQLSELLNTVVQDISYTQGVFAKGLRFNRPKSEKIQQALDNLREHGTRGSDGNISKRIEALSHSVRNSAGDTFWANIVSETPTNADYQKELIDLLSGFACRTKNSPYIARGLIYHRFSYPNDEAGADRGAVIALLRDDNCKGTKSLSEEDWRALDIR